MPIEYDGTGNPIGAPYYGADGVLRDCHGNPTDTLVREEGDITALAGQGGADMIGTDTPGETVQEAIDLLESEIATAGGAGGSATVSSGNDRVSVVIGTGYVAAVASININPNDPNYPFAPFGTSLITWINGDTLWIKGSGAAPVPIPVTWIAVK